MSKQKRATVSALEAIEILLKNAHEMKDFEGQIKMIHAFTQDVLKGHFDTNSREYRKYVLDNK